MHGRAPWFHDEQEVEGDRGWPGLGTVPSGPKSIESFLLFF